jgi:uncharacterized protein (DUF488 family)
MDSRVLFTIGFTKKSAKTFFSTLQNEGVKRIIDVRLNNISQLAGFAKRDDLSYFLEKICKCAYIHRKSWAPTQDILESYKQKKISWTEYENSFSNLIKVRRIEKETDADELSSACLLCSELDPQKCHRRLVAEYLHTKFSNVRISHL